MRLNTSQAGQKVWVRELMWASALDAPGFSGDREQRTEIAWSPIAFVRTARKPATCDTCGRRIARGEVHASGTYGYPHWCAACVRSTEPPFVVAPRGYPHERTIAPEE